jgi:hypothetical protein
LGNWTLLISDKRARGVVFRFGEAKQLKMKGKRSMQADYAEAAGFGAACR